MRLRIYSLIVTFLTLLITQGAFARGVERDTFEVLRAKDANGQQHLYLKSDRRFVYVAGDVDVSLNSGGKRPSFHLSIPNSNLKSLEGKFLSEVNESPVLEGLESLYFVLGDVTGDGYDDMFVPAFGVFITGLMGEHGGAPEVFFQASTLDTVANKEGWFDNPYGEEWSTTPYKLAHETFTKFNVSTQQWEATNLTFIIRDSNDDGLEDLYIFGSNTRLAIATNAISGTFEPSVNTESEVLTGKNQTIGAIAGQADISGGQFAYNIPISTPAGTAGVQPSLSISYSSGSGNGSMGVGLSLNIGSNIGRCPKSWLFDNEPGELKFDSTDKLCLDGQRLVLSSGIYGFAGATYRTANESWTEVIQHGSNHNAWFEVKLKNGDIHSYGKVPTVYDRFATNSIVHLDNGKVISWSLAKIEDRSGNYMVFVYDKYHANFGNALVTSILYTGNDAKGLEPYNEVSVKYKKRHDVQVSYSGGGKSILETRISKIEALSEGKLFREYHIEYKDKHDTEYVLNAARELVRAGLGVSQVDSITECTSTSCIAPTRFSWSQNVSVNNLSMKLFKETPLYSDAAVGPGVKGWSSVQYPDINGDSYTDVCGFFNWSLGDWAWSVPEPKYVCNLGTETGFDYEYLVLPLCNDSNEYFSAEDCNADNHYKTISYLDIDGDGDDDIVWRSDSGLAYTLWNGTGFDPAKSASLGQKTSHLKGIAANYDVSANNKDNYYTIQYPDIDGDSLPDICYRNDSQGIRCFLNISDRGIPGWDYANPINTGICKAHELFGCNDTKNWDTIRFVDANGDGRSDIVYVSDNGVKVWYSNGQDFGDSPSIETGICGEDEELFACDDYREWNSIRFPDLNGDGLPELCFSNAGQLTCLAGSGDGWQDNLEGMFDLGIEDWQKLVQSHVDRLQEKTYLDKLATMMYSFSDFNDDGRPDLLYKNEDIGARLFLNVSDGKRVVFVPTSLNDDICAPKGSTSASADICSDVKNWGTLAPIDFDNDGIQEVIFRSKEGLKIYKTEVASLPNYVTGIDNGFGLTTTIQYKTLGNGDTDFYRVTQQSNVYPLNSTGGPIQVVAAVSTKDGSKEGSYETTSYQYENLMMHRLGLGPLGYSKITAKNVKGVSGSSPGSNVRTTVTEYNQDYSNHQQGSLVRSQSYVNGGEEDGVLISETTNRYKTFILDKNDNPTTHQSLFWANKLAEQGFRYTTYLEATETRNYELTATHKLVNASASYSKYGDNGNLSYSIIYTAENPISFDSNNIPITPSGSYFATEAHNWYGYDDKSTWSLGRLSVAQGKKWGVDKLGNEVKPMVRTSSWTYDSETGGVRSERVLDIKTLIINQGAVTEESLFGSSVDEHTLGVATFYEKASVFIDADGNSRTFDNFGVLNKTTVRDSKGNERTTAAFTDEKGRYTQSSFDVLKGESRTYVDPLLGVPKTVIDANLQTTTYEHDSFGRVKRTQYPNGNWSVIRMYKCSESSAPIACPDFGTPNYIIESRSSSSPPSYVVKDILGRDIRGATKSFDGTWQYKDTEYDASGRVYRSTEPYFQGDTPIQHFPQYDVLGRLERVAMPNGLVKELIYNGGETIEKNTFNEKTQVGTSYTDPAGRLYKTVDHIGNEVNFIFNAYGNKTHTIGKAADAANSDYVIQMFYDDRGQKERMIDPDKGAWNYRYDDFGQLTYQVDANGIMTCNRYDAAGRPIIRFDEFLGTSAEAINGCNISTNNSVPSAQWQYDTAPRIGGGKPWLGLLHTITDNTGFKKVFSYDTYGRVTNVEQSIDSVTYNTSTTYDEHGRIETVTYPSSDDQNRLKIVNNYNALGFLEEIKNDSGESYWKVLEVNARGDITRETLGAGAVTTDKAYRPTDGLLTHISSSSILSGANDLQDDSYTFDPIGNLTYRRFAPQGAVYDWDETAVYDNINRLKSVTFTDHTLNTSSSTVMDYWANGNIKQKPGVGTFHYGAKTNECNGKTFNIGPNALNKVTHGDVTKTYCYDGTGNLLNGNGRVVKWTAFGKPREISKGNASVQILYGPDHSRYKRIDKSGEETTTYTYVGGAYEKIQKSNGQLEEKHYIGGFAVVTVKNRDVVAKETHYILKDHIGSSSVIVNSSGGVVQRMAFDAWGQRRSVFDGSVLSEVALVNLDEITTRGFTGHEMLDAVGLVHMNGRVYDPELGRFLSADPFVQSPANLQSLNRFIYVFNNPLSFTDPTGYWSFSKAFNKFHGINKDIFNVAFADHIYVFKKSSRELGRLINKNKYLGTAIQVVGCAVASAFGQVWVCPVLAAAVTQSSTYHATGDFNSSLRAGAKAYAIAYVQQGVYGWVGDTFTGTFSGIAAHAVAGGAFAEIQGGNFSDGALMGAVNKGISTAGGYEALSGNAIVRTIAAAVVGGSLSKATGGKFANGAITAAMAHLFNDEMHREDAQEGQLTHEYQMETEICSTSASQCTTDNVWASVKDNSVPFQDGTLTDGTVSTIPGIGSVTTRVDDANYTLVNQTHDDHFFRHGTVTRSLVISESAISVRTVGVGTNTGYISWGANYVAAPYFKGLDMNIKANIAVQQFRHDYGQ